MWKVWKACHKKMMDAFAKKERGDLDVADIVLNLEDEKI